MSQQRMTSDDSAPQQSSAQSNSRLNVIEEKVTSKVEGWNGVFTTPKGLIGFFALLGFCYTEYKEWKKQPIDPSVAAVISAAQKEESKNKALGDPKALQDMADAIRKMADAIEAQRKPVELKKTTATADISELPTAFRTVVKTPKVKLDRGQNSIYATWESVPPKAWALIGSHKTNSTLKWVYCDDAEDVRYPLFPGSYYAKVCNEQGEVIATDAMVVPDLATSAEPSFVQVQDKNFQQLADDIKAFNEARMRDSAAVGQVLNKLQGAVDDANAMVTATNRRLDALTNEPKKDAAPAPVQSTWQTVPQQIGGWSSSPVMMGAPMMRMGIRRSAGGCSGGS